MISRFSSLLNQLIKHQNTPAKGGGGGGGHNLTFCAVTAAVSDNYGRKHGLADLAGVYFADSGDSGLGGC